MTALTCAERMVLEALGPEARTPIDVMNRTGLPRRFTLNILNALSARGLLTQQGGLYAVSSYLSEEDLALIKGKDNLKIEAMEIIQTMMNSSERCFYLKKVFVNQRDRAILQSMFKNIEQFLASLPIPDSEIKISDYHLVTWGCENYGENMSRMLGERL